MISQEDKLAAICLVPRPQSLCSPVTRVFPGCVRARSGAEGHPPNFRYSPLLVVPESGRPPVPGHWRSCWVKPKVLLSFSDPVRKAYAAFPNCIIRDSISTVKGKVPVLSPLHGPFSGQFVKSSPGSTVYPAGHREAPPTRKSLSGSPAGLLRLRPDSPLAFPPFPCYSILKQSNQ